MAANVNVCYSCQTFQVQQQKKVNKWTCKMCGDRQSIKKVYGEGSGADCRHHVQEMNTLRGQMESAPTANNLTPAGRYTDEVDTSLSLQEQHTISGTDQSRWTQYVQDNDTSDQVEEHMSDDDALCTTDTTIYRDSVKQQRKRKKLQAQPYENRRQKGGTLNQENLSRHITDDGHQTREHSLRVQVPNLVDSVGYEMHKDHSVARGSRCDPPVALREQAMGSRFDPQVALQEQAMGSRFDPPVALQEQAMGSRFDPQVALQEQAEGARCDVQRYTGKNPVNLITTSTFKKESKWAAFVHDAAEYDEEDDDNADDYEEDDNNARYGTGSSSGYICRRSTFLSEAEQNGDKNMCGETRHIRNDSETTQYQDGLDTGGDHAVPVETCQCPAVKCDPWGCSAKSKAKDKAVNTSSASKYSTTDGMNVALCSKSNADQKGIFSLGDVDDMDLELNF